MLKTIYIHIGAPKTGTTSLQNYFYQNEESLNRFNTAYFTELALNGNHWSLLHEISIQNSFFVNDAISLAGVEDLCNYLAGSQFETGLISSESLTFYLNNPIKTTFIEKMADELSRLGVEIYIIGVVREPVSYLVSAYGEDVVGCGCPFSFAGWMETLQGKGHRNVIMSMQKWSQLVGDDHMLWFPYSGSPDFAVEMIRHIIKRFSKTALDMPEPHIPFVRQSFSASQIEAVRRFNTTKNENWYKPVIDNEQCELINHTFKHEPQMDKKPVTLNCTENELRQIYKYVKTMWDQIEGICWQNDFKIFDTCYDFDVFRAGLSKLAFDETKAAMFYKQLNERLIELQK